MLVTVTYWTPRAIEPEMAMGPNGGGSRRQCKQVGFEEHKEQGAMTRALAFLLAIALLAGCTSTGSSPLLPDKYAKCNGLSWSWCAGYHGGR